MINKHETHISYTWDRLSGNADENEMIRASLVWAKERDGYEEIGVLEFAGEVVVWGKAEW